MENRGKEVTLLTIGRASSSVFEAYPGTQFLPSQIPPLCLRLEVSLLGIVGVKINAIVANEELGFNDFGLKSCILQEA